mmetsp:Transcript_5033/g.3474  ORF Transcript_5033/g.3474 Transcript_5033/m.3474 type:complete len:80 (+) Transcript_5033:718-957(+)|eukprot:CAMPEP_0116877008 /NCGR_PEP_ID=MMETSP0463-20121206/8850_1 /TAXON_ID=181622 /ORGANISM="Strombidinopsis sp, Strain SopsisLIS2011" /LENGTH=79 /DNA_ID=CAMNT_0004523983 /DNA_START=627 /DNA_END=866 /DNA_ORIENTATION=+
MDLGLNHVTRKCTFPVDMSAHLLMQVPGDEGPGGIIVVCENKMVYLKPNHEDRTCAIPLRYDWNKDKGLFINCYTIHRH